MHKKIVGLFILLIFTSCQNIKRTNATEINNFQTLTFSVPTPIPDHIAEVTIPAITPKSSATKILKGKSDFIRTFPKTENLKGIITISAGQTNILLDFNKNGVYKLNCTNPDYESNDICFINSHPIPLSDHPIEIKRLNSNFLAVFEDLDNHKSNIYRFDKVSGTLEKIYTIDMIKDHWLTTPEVSNDALTMAGVKNKGPWDNQLAIINLENGSEREVKLELPYFMTYNLAWSPSDQEILVGASNIQSEIGFCTNHLLVYNVENFSIIAQFSSDTIMCFDDFGLIARSNTAALWSPDEKKIVVIADHKELCIVNVEEPNISCFKPVDQLNAELRSVQWSPDSNFVAYVTTGDKSQISIFNVQNEETVFIEDLGRDLPGVLYELNWKDH